MKIADQLYRFPVGLTGSVIGPGFTSRLNLETAEPDFVRKLQFGANLLE